MGRTLAYPQSSRNAIKRFKDRGTLSISIDISRLCFLTGNAGDYDLGKIHAIVNETPICHISFNPDPDDPFPAILPMIGVMGSFEYPSAGLDEPLDCYLHGYVSSRVMNLARASDKGLPLCIAASRVDGLVLSLTPNSHSFNYRSAVLHGYGKIVQDVNEKLYAMQLITNSVLQDRWANTRTPPDGAEMQSTVILKVEIVSGSGKIRDGEPHDDAKDTKREDLTNEIWTGVVPVWEAYGDPVPSSVNRVAEVPEHIKDHISALNETNEQYARNAIANEKSD